MLVNPINFRLSTSIFWNSTWSLYKNGNYKYLFYSDLVFFEFFMFFFKKTLIKGHFDNYATHLRLYRVEGKIILNLYYHTVKEEWYQDELDILLKGNDSNCVAFLNLTSATLYRSFDLWVKILDIKNWPLANS